MKQSQSFLTVRSGHVSQGTSCPHVLIWQMPPSLTLEEFTRKSLLLWGFLHKFNMKNCFATTEILLALLMLFLILCCGINSFDVLCFCEFSAKEKHVYFGRTVQLVLSRLETRHSVTELSLSLMTTKFVAICIQTPKIRKVQIQVRE